MKRTPFPTLVQACLFALVGGFLATIAILAYLTR